MNFMNKNEYCQVRRGSICLRKCKPWFPTNLYHFDGRSVKFPLRFTLRYSYINTIGTTLSHKIIQSFLKVLYMDTVHWMKNIPSTNFPRFFFICNNENFHCMSILQMLKKALGYFGGKGSLNRVKEKMLELYYSTYTIVDYFIIIYDYNIDND